MKNEKGGLRLAYLGIDKYGNVYSVEIRENTVNGMMNLSGDCLWCCFYKTRTRHKRLEIPNLSALAVSIEEAAKANKF